MRAMKHYGDLIKERLAGAGLTFAQPKVLYSLIKHDGITQRELAEQCYVDSTTMSRLLDGMEQKGLITRRDSDDCRRSFSIHITASGREKMTKAGIIMQEVEEQLLKDFSEKEKEQFFDFLGRIERA